MTQAKQWRLVGIMLCIVAFFGCSAHYIGTVVPGKFAMELESGGTAKPLHHRIADVPFFADNTDQCGPAALASVLTFWGVPTTPGELRNEVYTPWLQGSLPLDLFLAARARGLAADAYEGSLGNIKAEMELGHPLIAFLDPGPLAASRGHFVVITGYDEYGLYMHSGRQEHAFIPHVDFVRQWNKRDRWLLRVLPKSARQRQL